MVIPCKGVSQVLIRLLIYLIPYKRDINWGSIPKTRLI